MLLQASLAAFLTDTAQLQFRSAVAAALGLSDPQAVAVARAVSVPPPPSAGHSARGATPAGTRAAGGAPPPPGSAYLDVTFVISPPSALPGAMPQLGGGWDNAAYDAALYALRAAYAGDGLAVGFAVLQPPLLLCQPGSYTYPSPSQPGVSLCALCPAGTVSVDGSLGACLICPPGSHSPLRGQQTCPLCPSGYFSPQPGAGLCTPCGPGEASSQDGATSCAPCEDGEFAPSPAQTNCTLCPPGSVSGTLAQALVDAGMYSAGIASTPVADALTRRACIALVPPPPLPPQEPDLVILTGGRILILIIAIIGAAAAAVSAGSAIYASEKLVGEPS